MAVFVLDKRKFAGRRSQRPVRRNAYWPCCREDFREIQHPDGSQHGPGDFISVLPCAPACGWIPIPCQTLWDSKGGVAGGRLMAAGAVPPRLKGRGLPRKKKTMAKGRGKPRPLRRGRIALQSARMLSWRLLFLDVLPKNRNRRPPQLAAK